MEYFGAPSSGSRKYQLKVPRLVLLAYLDLVSDPRRNDFPKPT